MGLDIFYAVSFWMSVAWICASHSRVEVLLKLSPFGQRSPFTLSELAFFNAKLLPRMGWGWLLAITQRGCRELDAETSFSVDGIRVYCITGSTLMKFNIKFGLWEASEKMLVEQFLPRDARVLELGGCYGYVSTVINRRLDDPVKHVVVEANASVVPSLEQTKACNDAKFQIRHCVVTARDVGAVSFNVGCNDWASTAEMTAVSTCWEPLAKTIEVPALRRCDLEREVGFEFDTLVLDIEGGEYELLRDSGFLRGINLIIAEFHGGMPHLGLPWTNDQLKEHVCLLGFACVSECGQNYVFRRR